MARPSINTTKTRSFSLTLSLAMALSPALSMLSAPAALAKKDKTKKTSVVKGFSSTGSGASSSSTVASANAAVAAAATAASAESNPGHVGNAALDRDTLTAINSGDWKTLSDRLGTTFDGTDLLTSYRRAWQAFALMYQSRYEELDTLFKTLPKEAFEVPTGGAVSDDQKRMVGNALIVKAFNLIGKNDLVAAETVLKSAPEISSSDAIYNFALAAVAGKRGQIAAAVQYSKRATELDPRFAWGYRTIGFLAQKLLKDNNLAEDAYTRALLVEPRLAEARDLLVEVKLARNDFDGASDVAIEAIQLDPKSSVNHFRLAQILTQQWRLREALKELDEAIADDGGIAKYYRNRASLKRFQRNFDGAIADQSHAVELSKDKGFELTELANLYVAAGNKDKAIENYKQALTVAGGNDVAREKLFKLLVEEKRYNDLLGLYQDQLTRYPNDAGLHLGYAAVLLASGDKTKAIDEFHKSASLNLTDPLPHRALGAYYMEQKQFAEAAKEYTAALNILPTSVKDMVFLGFCYAENDDYMQAEAAFTTAMALQKLNPAGQPDDPTAIDVMRSLAYLLYDEGRFADAASQFENIIAIYRGKGATTEDNFFLARCRLMRDLGAGQAKALVAIYKSLPEARQAILRYGMIESLLDAGESGTARVVLDEVPQENRNTMAYALYDAAIDRLAGDSKKALTAIAPAVPMAEAAKSEDRPLAARVLCEKARAQMNTGEIEGAIATTKQALALYEKSFPANMLMAELLIKKGDAAGALTASHRALELNPYFAQAYVTSGEAQQAAGKTAQAIDSFKKAIDLYPTWVEAHRALARAYRKQGLAKETAKEDAEIGRLEGLNGKGKTQSAAPAASAK